jgi:glycosyltransferase involved in cell wall biosynthesis
MRICVVYDCLYPHTVGGAERWYRNLSELLAADGHEVTYVTMRQWPGDEVDSPTGVRVRPVSPRMGLYTRDGRRRILPPIVFGVGMLAHLLRRGRRYDVVHMASFPYFSVLAAAIARPLGGFRLVVDWFEVWSRDYWREYLGPAGRIGWWVQKLCARVRQRAFCFSQLHARRLQEIGGNVDAVLEGAYSGPLEPPEPQAAEPVVVFAGRHIPEKRVPVLVPAIATALKRTPNLRCDIYGDGPERPVVERRIAEEQVGDAITSHGFVAADEIDTALRRAACMILPSRREGYGLIVVEAAAVGTPSVVVAGPDNAATELVESGRNGVIAPSASADDLAGAIAAVLDAGMSLRESTAEWFGENAYRLSLESSLDRVVRSYRGGSERRRRNSA